MLGEGATLRPVRFGPFELAVDTGELRKAGVRLKLLVRRNPYGKPGVELTCLH